jgi:hypothetical protein
MSRQSQDMLQNIAAVQAQGDTIRAARARREQWQRHIARQFVQADDAGFKTLVPLLPPDYRPLVQALVQENNELLLRVQQRVRQNHLMLARAVDLMQRFITSMFSSGNTTVYNEGGRLMTPGRLTAPMYEAVV